MKTKERNQSFHAERLCRVIQFLPNCCGRRIPVEWIWVEYRYGKKTLETLGSTSNIMADFQIYRNSFFSTVILRCKNDSQIMNKHFLFYASPKVHEKLFELVLLACCFLMLLTHQNHMSCEFQIWNVWIKNA